MSGDQSCARLAFGNCSKHFVPWSKAPLRGLHLSAKPRRALQRPRMIVFRGHNRIFELECSSYSWRIADYSFPTQYPRVKYILSSLRRNTSRAHLPYVTSTCQEKPSVLTQYLHTGRQRLKTCSRLSSNSFQMRCGTHPATFAAGSPFLHTNTCYIARRLDSLRRCSLLEMVEADFFLGILQSPLQIVPVLRWSFSLRYERIYSWGDHLGLNGYGAKMNGSKKEIGPGTLLEFAVVGEFCSAPEPIDPHLLREGS